jgi:hypothetical protein
MIKVIEDADMLKVLRRIPYKLMEIKTGYKGKVRATLLPKESAMQGMKY